MSDTAQGQVTAQASMPAHDQKVTLHIVEHFPPHEPRAGDPAYKYFNQARQALAREGKLVCWVCKKDAAAAGAPIELHHNVVEYALANGVDLSKFEALFPEFNVTDTESFLRFVESEGNLLPLCVCHHRGSEGIHSMTYPSWRAQAYWRDGFPPPAEMVTG